MSSLLGDRVYMPLTKVSSETVWKLSASSPWELGPLPFTGYNFQQRERERESGAWTFWGQPDAEPPFPHQEVPAQGALVQETFVV